MYYQMYNDRRLIEVSYCNVSNEPLYEFLLLSFPRSQTSDLATASRGSRLRLRGASSRPSEGKIRINYCVCIYALKSPRVTRAIFFFVIFYYTLYITYTYTILRKQRATIR